MQSIDTGCQSIDIFQISKKKTSMESIDMRCQSIDIIQNPINPSFHNVIHLPHHLPLIPQITSHYIIQKHTNAHSIMIKHVKFTI